MSTSLQSTLAKVGKEKLTDEEVRRFRIHHVWPSPDENKNHLILDALQSIEERGPVIIISEGHVLDGYYELPMLETPGGRRYFGVNNIRKYAENFKS